MNILVACAESQRVAIAFRNKGHTTYRDSSKGGDKMPKQTRKTRGLRFGEILKDAHIKSGLTNEQFAALLKLPYVTIWRYENNKRTPTLNNAELILKKLGLSMTIGKR